MAKRIAVMLGTVASIILILCILFTALQLTMNNDRFIEYEYSHLSLAREMGMTNMDLVASCERLIDYMEGRVDSIDIEVTVNGEKTLMFAEEQEISHMADVRILYQQFRTYRDFGVLAALVLYLFAAVMHMRSSMHTLASGYCWGAFVIALFVGFLGTWASLDFSSFWTFFHQMLFWNEDWLFDPSTSRMINMMPEQFFADFILRMVLLGGAVIVLLLIASIIALASIRKKRRIAREKYIAAKLEKRRQALEKREKAAAEAAKAEATEE